MLAGRFYCKTDREGNPILIGAGVNGLLKDEHVYEIVDIEGNLVIREIGESQISKEPIAKGGMDALLALSKGRHCLVGDEK